MITADLNSAILREGNSFNIDFKRISFYVKNFWVLKTLHFLHLTYIMRLEVTACNFKLKQRSEVFKKLLDALMIHSVNTQDLNSQIQVINSQIECFSSLREKIEEIFVFKQHKVLGDFEGTHKIITEMLETYYTILRIYKKANKKVIPTSTSQLAKDTAAHANFTLSKIINAD